MPSASTPRLIRLYIRHCAIGFALSAVFVGGLFAFDVANLWTLVSRSEVGLMAAFMLFMGNGVVFAGVQFGISVMRMGEDDAGPRGGQRDPVAMPALVPVRTAAAKTPHGSARRV
jgi:hypothetical protein